MGEASVVAIIVAIVTTVGVKAVEFFFGRVKSREDAVAKQIEAKQQEINVVKAELEKLRVELEESKSKMYDLRDEKSKAETRLMIALESIKRLENTE